MANPVVAVGGIDRRDCHWDTHLSGDVVEQHTESPVVRVIVIKTESAGIKQQIFDISAKSSEVAVSEDGGKTYVPSNTVRNAGVVAIAKILEQVVLADRHLSCQRVPFLAYF